MTREDMANGLQACDPRDDKGRARPQAQALLDVIAVELRKTCAGCKWFDGPDSNSRLAACHKTADLVPPDGSGFCHRWEAKP